MSLRPEPIAVVPGETARVARADFPKGNLYLKMCDELGTFYKDEDFAELFPTRRQPETIKFFSTQNCFFCSIYF